MLGPLEQLDAQLPLKALDGLAERRLRDVQCRGRGRECAVVGDGEEILQRAAIDSASLTPGCRALAATYRRSLRNSKGIRL
jgi:hypothetical protein